MPKINQDIRQMTMENTDFRREILTNKFTQLVLMSVEPGDEIGEETHEGDQILYFVDGEGEAILAARRARSRRATWSRSRGHAAQLRHTGDRAEALTSIAARGGPARHKDKARRTPRRPRRTTTDARTLTATPRRRGGAGSGSADPDLAATILGRRSPSST